MSDLFPRRSFVGWFLFGLLFTTAGTVSGQALDSQRSIAFLKLNAADRQVLNYGYLSLDSTLIVACREHGISPALVITEGMNDAFTTSYSRWMNTGYVDSLLALLPELDAAGRAEGTLLIGAWYAFQPGRANYRKAIAFLLQARQEANRWGKPEWEAQCYCLLGKAYYMLGDTAGGRKWFGALAGNPSFKGMDAVQAKALSYAGMYCPSMPETYQYRLDCLTEAEKRYSLLKDTGNQINALMDLSYMRLALYDASSSEEAATRALKLQQVWNFPYTQYCYDHLAFLRKYQDDYTGALQLALASLKATESTADRWFLPRAYSRIGDVYVLLINEDVALEWRRKALQAQIALGPDMLLYRLLPNIWKSYGEQALKKELLNTVRDIIARYPPTNAIQQQLAYSALGKCYTCLDDLPNALHYQQLAWQLEPQVIKMKVGVDDLSLIIDLAYINFRTGNYKESRKFLEMILTPPVFKEANQRVLWYTYYNLYRVDSAMGRFRSALHYFYLYDSVNEHVLDVKTTNEVLKLKEQYEALQREKKVQQLEAENQLERQKDASTKKLYLGGFVLLGVIIILVFLLYYNKFRKNRKLRAQAEEIDKQNRALQQLNHEQAELIEEKEWLLHEVHHRVKNNLQLITSLLLSQSEFIRDQTAIDIMKESRRRVETMSLIHQKLYNSGNLSSIYMPEYIGDLVDYFKESFILLHKIVFHLDIEKIRLDVSKAMPLGLILNEVITNAFKYAFPHTPEDRIWIRLTVNGEWITLEVKDNGRGLPPDFDLATSSSFGMILMRGMAEDLQSIFEVNGTDGTCISIRFKDQASTSN